MGVLVSGRARRCTFNKWRAAEVAVKREDRMGSMPPPLCMGL